MTNGKHKQKNRHLGKGAVSTALGDPWLRGLDLNQRPSGYEGEALQAFSDT
jgi:hypothetical protein